MDLKLLKELCDTPGVPGCEEHISHIVQRELKKFADEVVIDPMGNTLFKINGSGGP